MKRRGDYAACCYAMMYPISIGLVLVLLLSFGHSFLIVPQQQGRRSKIFLASTNDDPQELPSRIYLDIEVNKTPLGRLVFQLATPSPLPLHTENIVKLCRGDVRGIDPRATYVGCEFDYSPASIEDGMGRYRWGHVLKGRGRNAIMGGRESTISEPENQRQCTHACFGGQYYGDVYQKDEYPGVCLTVPILGPGCGSTRFSIVRVGESPQEWRERLLLNSGVIGRLEESSLDTLHAMARQQVGPPTITACGVL